MAQDIRWLQRFSNYCKALAKLGQAVDIVSWRLELADEIDELLQEGLIQRFEYTRELVWKVMRNIKVIRIFEVHVMLYVRLYK